MINIFFSPSVGTVARMVNDATLHNTEAARASTETNAGAVNPQLRRKREMYFFFFFFSFFLLKQKKKRQQISARDWVWRAIVKFCRISQLFIWSAPQLFKLFLFQIFSFYDADRQYRERVEFLGQSIQ